MSTDFRPYRFVHTVWKINGAFERDGVWGFVARKDGTRWLQDELTPPKPLYAEAAGAVWEDTTDNGYFCPHLFRSGQRRDENHNGRPARTRWLHADLDETDPRTIAPRPTVAWETSPGRYQALWLLTEFIGPLEFRDLNAKLNYAVGADTNGWSITKMLRVPFTKSLKYDDPHFVRLLWLELAREYRPKKIEKRVRHIPLSVAQAEMGDMPPLPDESADSILRRLKLPSSTRMLIRARKTVVGQRSEKLWQLECSLLEAGATPIEAVVVVRHTVWNKFANTRRELPQLWTEVNKANKYLEEKQEATKPASKVKSTKRPHKRSLFVPYGKLMSTMPPSQLWLIESVWGYQGHGLIVGEPKTYKSLIAMDMAFSVATATPFLNTFPIPKKGPVILIQRENPDHLVQDRFRKMAYARGLGGSYNGTRSNGKAISVRLPTDAPIYSLPLNVPFDLREDDDLKMLRKEIKRLKPSLVVLDPLYRLAPGMDENDNAQVAVLLDRLMPLKFDLGVGLLIVHHMNKPQADEKRSPITRISGAGTFGRWFESALYLEKGREFGSVVMTPEHRMATPAGKIYVDILMGEIGDLDFDLEVQVVKEEIVSIKKRVRELINANSGIKVSDASRMLDLSPERLKRLISKMNDVAVRKGKPDGTPGRPSPRLYMVK